MVPIWESSIPILYGLVSISESSVPIHHPPELNCLSTVSISYGSISIRMV